MNNFTNLGTILIVDDEQTYLDIIANTLQKRGFKVLQALNGQMGLQVAQKFLPDIIVMDWEMPKLNGIEAIRLLKQHEITRDIPIIMATGVMTSVDSLETALGAGAIDFVRKPIEPLEIVARINSALKLSRSYKKIKVQKRELETLNSVLAQTYREVEKKNDDITASISYAQRIQNAMLPTEDEIHQLLPESFVLFKPRDIVSGDCYWIAEKIDSAGNRKVIISAIDCTGHGVPGAFMSMIANDLLNQIVHDWEIHQPDLILNHMHRLVRKALKQEDVEHSIRDGMDMALVMIDYGQGQVEYAGAHNPLVFVQNRHLETVKGNRFSVGGYQIERERVFTRHIIPFANTPTTLYLFSDGFQDEFGGHDNKKFTVKRFRELLGEIHPLGMPEQKKLLNQMHDDWRRDFRQIDDVLVIGVRV